MGMDPDAEAPRRMLVVAYYFPPMGLSGVQRVSKFVKYLPDFGWHPTVLTVAPGGYFAFDPSLEDDLRNRSVDVVRTASFDPTRLFRRGKAVSMPAERTRSLFSRVSQFAFVPDNKIGWYVPAVRAGKRLHGERRFDAIFSSAPPYTAHLIGASLTRSTGAPLVLDFRDDWVGNPRHVYPTPTHRALHRRLERHCLSRADRVVTINRHIQDQLCARNADVLPANRVHVLPPGYDPEDFSPASPARAIGDQFTLLYTGTFYDVQTPDTLFRAVARVVSTSPRFVDRIRLEFAGTLPPASLALARKLGIASLVVHPGYLSHVETVSRMKAADVLWMVVGRRAGAEGISTGKLFEYFGSRKPILAFVPEGEARESLRGYCAAYVVDPDDVGAAADQLAHLLYEWECGTLPTPPEHFVQQFDRRELARKLARLCDNL